VEVGGRRLVRHRLREAQGVAECGLVGVVVEHPGAAHGRAEPRVVDRDEAREAARLVADEGHPLVAAFGHR
jgi:hypothetical protein